MFFIQEAAPGSQHFACQFGGDQLTSFQGLKYAIAGGLSAAASGLPFWVSMREVMMDSQIRKHISVDRVCCILSIDAFPWNGAERAVGIRCFYSESLSLYTWLRENLRPDI